MHAHFANLLPYQCEDVDFLVANKRAGLVLEQGLGKTVIAIRACDAIGPRRVAVACPPIGIAWWHEAFRVWGLEPHQLRTVSYGALQTNWRPAIEALAEFEPHVLILDEAHYLKSAHAKRTQALYGNFARGDGFVSVVPRVWLLSGTLTPNGVQEMYPHLRALWPEVITFNGKPMNEPEFYERYCWTSVEPRTQRILFRGTKPAVQDLRELVRPFMRRRLKRDVLPELPAILFNVVPLTPTSAFAQVEAGQRRLFDDALDALEAGVEVDEAPLATIERELGLAKAPLVAEYVTQVLDGGRSKVIVFAHHVDVVGALEQLLAKYKPVSITGRTSAKRRAEAERRFQDVTSDCRVFIGNIRACGTTITLTAADRVVFAEASWVPGENAQAAARPHRIGQTRGVLVDFCTVPGSIDEVRMRVLHRKTRDIAKLWTTPTEEAA